MAYLTTWGCSRVIWGEPAGLLATEGHQGCPSGANNWAVDPRGVSKERPQAGLPRKGVC